MICQIKNIKKKIINLLTEKPHLRDSDDKLIANLWCEEMGKDNTGKLMARKLTAFDFLMAFAENQYTSPESIRRSRQKVQEQMPELRGKSYKNRKNATIEFKKEINKI